MKGCFKFVLLLVGLLALIGLVSSKVIEWRMTPEQRAARDEQQRVKAVQEANLAAAKTESQRRKNAEVEELQQPFLEELVKLPGLDQARFTGNDTLEVRFAPLVHIGEDHVRVMCENIAKLWGARAGLKYVRCESWYGSKRYAVGEYDGPIPEAYIAKVLVEAMEKQQEKNAAALVALEGKTLVEVEGTHGPTTSRDKTTGWAEFRTFHARFENGKVAEVMVK
ncbi:hypothetical protein [Prosthecobacter sp.]|uniref:hypothetical protein n=1 Tax=Prosthecobacter sp. TaxID=1965333 RepID=UPI002ABCB5E1|nr:hypothetical protein [Prosthecobacter sp.]MDZ4402262.1 hypothetical protein [Prosthecobacter sp.]